MEPRTVGVEILEDFNTGKFYCFDQNTGESRRCNALGNPIAKFRTDFTGMVGGLERKRNNERVTVVAQELDLLPKKLGRPTKYVGYTCLPRPGLDMHARGSECAFTLPSYLLPEPPKLGRVSTNKKKVEKKMKKASSLPTFQTCLDTQFIETLSMNYFTGGQGQFGGMRTALDVEGTTAKNRTTFLSQFEKQEEDEKKLSGKGRFGQVRPPYNAEEVRDKEVKRDEKINPMKARKAEEQYQKDKEGVAKRRRERYPEYFANLDEQRKAMEDSKVRPSVLEAAGSEMRSQMGSKESVSQP